MAGGSVPFSILAQASRFPFLFLLVSCVCSCLPVLLMSPLTDVLMTTPVKRKSETKDLRPPKLPKIVSGNRIIQTQLGIRKQLSPEEKDKYTSMPKPPQLNLFTQRVIDPKDFRCRWTNSSYAFSYTHENETVGMVSEEELAGPEWLNSKAHAKIVFDSTPDEDKFPHPIPALANAGVEVIEMSKLVMIRRKRRPAKEWESSRGRDQG